MAHRPPGEKAFGMDPFGWRVASAVVGSLMVLLMVRFVRRLTGSTTLGLVGGLLLSFDGMQLVLSRMALLDIFWPSSCWPACTPWCWTATGSEPGWPSGCPARCPARRGRCAGCCCRPWLLVSGVCFGLALGAGGQRCTRSRASGCWCGPGARARAAPSASAPPRRGRRWSTACRRSSQLVPVALVVYVGTWTGWLVHADR
ncbi:MAG: phospholipid carrier-dependent glycosyltransferase [Nocardioides sp.]